MRLLNLGALGRLGTWVPCHGFFFSIPGLSALFPSNGKEAAKASRDERGADGNWGFLNWWPSIDAVKLFLALLLISAMFAEIRCVVSSSMCPTLQSGDRVIVEKVSYYLRGPSINDIVTFRAPKVLQDMGYKKEDIFIKRIIARAGDLVEVHQGILYVNGTARTENFTEEGPNYRIRATVCSHSSLFPYLLLIFHSTVCQQRVSLNNMWSNHFQWKYIQASMMNILCWGTLEAFG